MNMISCEKENHIAILSLGAFESGEELYEQLHQSLSVIESDPEIYVLVLQGDGLLCLQNLLGEREKNVLSKRVEVLAAPVLAATKTLLPEAFLGCDIVISSLEAEEEAIRMAQQIAMNAPVAVQQIKRSVNHGLKYGKDAGLAYELQAFSLCHGTEDKVTGMKALINNENNKVFLRK